MAETSSNTHHHHHHHYHETEADRYKHHALSAQKRRKLWGQIMTIVMTIACIIMLAYIYWLYSNE